MKELTDLELNIRIAKSLGLFQGHQAGVETATVGDVLCWYDERRVIHRCHEDYIDNWNNLMPLVVEHDLTYDETGGVFYAYKYVYNNTDKDFCCESEFLQRALAECLLKILESKND